MILKESMKIIRQEFEEYFNKKFTERLLQLEAKLTVLEKLVDHIPKLDLEADKNNDIKTLNLSVRSENCIRNTGANTIADLLSKSTVELSRSRNFGLKSLKEVNNKLTGLYGVRLK